MELFSLFALIISSSKAFAGDYVGMVFYLLLVGLLLTYLHNHKN